MQVYTSIFERTKVIESNRWRIVTVVRDSGIPFWILHRRRDEHLPICAGIGAWIAVKYGDSFPAIDDAFVATGHGVGFLSMGDAHKVAARAAIECARTIVRKGVRPWPAARR